MKRFVAIFFALSLTGPSAHAADNAQREFIMSCTYGVLAGTLVGAASLAFVSKPGDNLQKVARGASLGLYTGILLGLYVVYVVPGMTPEEEEPVVKLPPVLISPTFSANNRLDGVKADWTVLHF
jgi:hypothetical protein